LQRNRGYDERMDWRRLRVAMAAVSAALLACAGRAQMVSDDRQGLVDRTRRLRLTSGAHA